VNLAVAAAAVAALLLPAPARSLAQAGAAVPVIVVETSRGAFAFETYPDDAPATVAHVVALVKSGFFDGQRIHRALPSFVVQFGDPQTRDPALRSRWGRGAAAGSGKPVGAVEITKRRLHLKGAVGMAHLGNPAGADSQIYVTLDRRPDLDGRYAVFGQVVAGEEVPARLQVGDQILKMWIRE
jgi:cyclophilin family peptidyl-prolyl cis-trans isomerase